LVCLEFQEVLFCQDQPNESDDVFGSDTDNVRNMYSRRTIDNPMPVETTDSERKKGLYNPEYLKVQNSIIENNELDTRTKTIMLSTLREGYESVKQSTSEETRNVFELEEMYSFMQQKVDGRDISNEAKIKQHKLVSDLRAKYVNKDPVVTSQSMSALPGRSEQGGGLPHSSTYGDFSTRTENLFSSPSAPVQNTNTPDNVEELPQQHISRGSLDERDQASPSSPSSPSRKRDIVKNIFKKFNK